MTRLLLAKGERLSLDTLRSALQDMPGLEVVATALDGHELLRALRSNRVDLIITDTDLPFVGGSELFRRIREISSKVRIMLLASDMEKELVFEAFRYEVSAFLLRNMELDGLKGAINQVQNGGTVIDPQVATVLVSCFSLLVSSRIRISVPRENISQLTAGEWKIIHEIEKGLTNSEIAENLHLSGGTVRNYITVILDKLRLRDRTQLAIWAVETSGLVRS